MEGNIESKVLLNQLVQSKDQCKTHISTILKQMEEQKQESKSQFENLAQKLENVSFSIKSPLMRQPKDAIVDNNYFLKIIFHKKRQH